MPVLKSEMIEIENVLQPGKTYRVDANKFNAMKIVFLKVLPSKSPGLTAEDIGKKILRKLPEDLFPQGATAGWWKKAVQLDLEAKGLIVRQMTKPLRWHKS